MDYESLSQKAHYIEVRARSLAEGMRSGNFRSLYRGQGIEMATVRDYIRGDDIRAIDWNVTARMGKPYVKVFEEQRELQIFLIVDKSLSMMVKNNGKSKYDSAVDAAALLSFAAEINECPLGAVFFDGKINFALAPSPGREQTMLILSHLEKRNQIQSEDGFFEAETKTPGSALDAALNGAGKRLKKRSLVFIFSDFRTTGFEKSLGILAHKNDVVAVRLTDSADEKLPPVGTFTFVDAETGVKKIYPSSSREFQKAWKTDFEKRTKAFDDFCKKHNVTNLSLNTNEDPLLVLNRVFDSKTFGN